jgi:hypothetical protein
MNCCPKKRFGGVNALVSLGYGLGIEIQIISTVGLVGDKKIEKLKS